MKSRFRRLLEKRFGEWRTGKTLAAMSAAALLGMTVGAELAHAQNGYNETIPLSGTFVDLTTVESSNFSFNAIAGAGTPRYFVDSSSFGPIVVFGLADVDIVAAQAGTLTINMSTLLPAVDPAPAPGEEFAPGYTRAALLAGLVSPNASNTLQFTVMVGDGKTNPFDVVNGVFLGPSPSVDGSGLLEIFGITIEPDMTCFANDTVGGVLKCSVTGMASLVWAAGAGDHLILGSGQAIGVAALIAGPAGEQAVRNFFVPNPPPVLLLALGLAGLALSRRLRGPRRVS